MYIFCSFFPKIEEETQVGNDTDGTTFDVELTKNTQGLGITIAGYIGDKISGNINSSAQIQS